MTPYILVTEFCERLTYYGLAGSLVLFFQNRLNYDNATADVQFSVWAGFCYVTPLLGGWLADSHLGRYRAILILSLVYLGGLALVVVGAIPGAESPALLFPALYVIAFGTGGIKPNVSTFGADQFDDLNPKDRREKESFFNWFYWSINLGALVSYTVVAYICQYGIAALGGEQWGFFIGFLIPTASMGLAILAFLSGTPKFRIAPPSGSTLSAACKIVWEALVTRRDASMPEGEYWVHRASQRFGGSHPHRLAVGVGYVAKLFPCLLLLVPFWLAYSQMSTTFQNQGCQMDLSVGAANIPVSALNLFDTVAILMLVPVFENAVYPALKRAGRPVTMLQKLGWGFVFSILSMLAAAALEVCRKRYAPADAEFAGLDGFLEASAHISACRNADDYDPRIFQAYYHDPSAAKPRHCAAACDSLGEDGLLSFDCIECDAVPQASSLSIFWQVPQFILVGTSEILTAVTAIEFFYSQAPANMRSISAALNLLTTAFGSWLTIPFVLIVNADPSDKWVPEDLNEGHLEYFFLVLAAFLAATLAVFVAYARGYAYVSVEEMQQVDGADSDDGVEVGRKAPLGLEEDEEAAAP